jgi:hypothetical protein
MKHGTEGKARETKTGLTLEGGAVTNRGDNRGGSASSAGAGKQNGDRRPAN